MARVLLRIFQILLAQIKMLADPLLDKVDSYAFFLRSDDVAQHLLCTWPAR